MFRLFSFFGPSTFIVAGVLAAFIAGISTAYFTGRSDGKARCQAFYFKKQLEEKERFEKERLALEEEAKELNLRFSQKIRSRERQIRDLDGRLNAYLNTTGPDTCALDDDGVQLLNAYIEDAPAAAP